jgi:hypothetical protein
MFPEQISIGLQQVSEEFNFASYCTSLFCLVK